MCLVRVLRKARRQIGQRAAMPVIGHHLKTVLSGSGKTRARRANRIERQGPDMRCQDVLAIAYEVQRTNLPVCLRPPAMWRRKHLHALRGAGQKRIDVPDYFAKILVQRNDVGIPAPEDQSFVDLYAGYAHEPVLGKIEILRKVPVKRCCHQPARPLIGPAVIRADEVANVARIRTTNLGPPVAAAVQKHMHAAVAVAHHDHRSTAQVPGNKISCCGNLRLMRQEYPGAIENPVHLESKYLVTHEHIAAHQPAPRIDPTVVTGCRSPCSHRARLCEISLTLQLSLTKASRQASAASSPSTEQAIGVFPADSTL